MIKIILIVSIFFTYLISTEIQWVGNPSIIRDSSCDNNESREVESNSSLDGNLTAFVWQ